MQFDLTDLFEFIEQALNQLFGPNIPPIIVQILAIIFLLIIALGTLYVLLFFIMNIVEYSKRIFQFARPYFYNEGEKRYSDRRRRFADYIESEIRRLNNSEAWSDYRFAELEAEVEAEGEWLSSSFIPFVSYSRTGLHREKSLSKALERSRSRIILLEGEPGSGKSVALRHMAQKMAHNALNKHTTKTLIPLYINLKNLRRPQHGSIDKSLIQTFVFQSLNRVNDRDIEEFLEEEFTKGLREGTWLFLFDSFDEIPDILSSVEADTIIRLYSDAISDFLHGMNQCRGIVASRQFRGPHQSAWPKFRILPLSEMRRIELIRRAGLKTALQDKIVGQIETTNDQIRGMASNPMFLGLLCDYMREGNPFPTNSHLIFENYIQIRLKLDEERLKRRFKLDIEKLRATAEVVAFCMIADPGLGLSATRENIFLATSRHGFLMSNDIMNLYLDALEFVKLARTEDLISVDGFKSFTFSHRRFQEYFATCIVLREPDRVSPNQLLTDARWRETTVVLCQTQSTEHLLSLIKEARHLLSNFCIEIEEYFTVEAKDFAREIERTIYDSANDVLKILSSQRWRPSRFFWPPNLLHILGILQTGFSNRLNDLPEGIRARVGHLVLVPTIFGNLPDRKWALSSSGIVAEPVMLFLLRKALNSHSQWLREAAYRQVAHLQLLPVDIGESIRIALVDLALSNRLRNERYATFAHLTRLNESANFLAIMRLLLWAPLIDAFAHLIIILLFYYAILISGSSVILSLNEILFLWPYILPFIGILLFWSYFGLWRRGSSNRKESLFELLFPRLLLVGFMSSYVQWGWLLVFSYVLSWAPCALTAAKRGILTWPAGWLLIPLSIFGAFPNYKSLLKSSFNYFDIDNVKFMLIFVSIIGWVFLLFLSPNDSYVAQYFVIVIPFSFLGFLALIWLIMGPSFFKFLISGITREIFYFLYDMIKWIQRIRDGKTALTISDFAAEFANYRSDKFTARYLRFVRQKNMLIPGEEIEELLNILAFVLEYGPEILNFKDSNDRDKAYSLEEWLNHYVHKHSQIKWGKAESLDEICLLLEQVRANRRSQVT